MDTIALVERYPAEDERVLAREIKRAVGGPAAIAAITLSRLGVSVALVGTVGADEDGQSVLRALSNEGVNSEGISVSSQATAGSVIVASQAHSARAISTRQPPEQAEPNERAKILIKDSQWLHVDHVGINHLEKYEVVRGSGPLISFDAGYDIKNFDVCLVDLFAPNDKSLMSRNAGRTLEEALKFEAEASASLVVATKGSEGSVAYSSETGFIFAPSFSVPVISTLGAGDVFHGALLAQLIEKRPLNEALLRANAVAALKCRGLDGSSAIPYSAELDSFMSGVK